MVKAVPNTRLDVPARDLARLIMDPCNAKLTQSIWPGAEGAFVGRFETDYIAYSSATETAGALVYCPGINAGYVNLTPAVLDTTATLLQSGAPAPGGSFFGVVGGTAASYRTVACCVQVSYPGSELTRAGIVSGGVVQFGTVAPNISTAGGGTNVATSVSALRTLSQHTERTPQNMMEITWFPGPGDMRFYNLNGNASITGSDVVTEGEDKNAIIITVAGLPVSTGVRIRIVTVFEWTPRAGLGVVSSAQTPASSSTLNDVLRALPASGGSNWFINAYKRSAPYLRAAGSVISYAAKTLGPALLAV